MRITGCRSCGKSELLPVLSLGPMPLSDGFLTPEELDRPEPRYPLDVVFCPSCGLVQILDTVPPEILFGRDYPYFSSVSATLLEHSRRHVAERLVALPPGAFVVEIASNDGYLLQFYKDAGVACLGIDPAPGPVAAARARGIETIEAFFGRDLAEELVAQGRHADLVHANNVLAHVADVHGFLDGVRILLKDHGRFVVEVPYVRDLVEKLAFDTIYHEHLCYFSVHAVARLARPHGLFLIRVERVPIHGGSLRLFFAKEERPDATVAAIMAEEEAIGLNQHRYYTDFAARVETLKAQLHGLVAELVRNGARIAAYGAAAKGTILLNACGLGRELIAWVADKNPFKQGRYVPGVRLPIVPPSRILEEMPDYLLILPWNIEAEITAQEATFRARGGRFIVPLPSPRIVP